MCRKLSYIQCRHDECPQLCGPKDTNTIDLVLSSQSERNARDSRQRDYDPPIRQALTKSVGFPVKLKAYLSAHFSYLD